VSRLRIRLSFGSEIFAGVSEYITLFITFHILFVKEVRMSFLKLNSFTRKAAALLTVAGVLVFAGGTFAANVEGIKITGGANVTVGGSTLPLDVSYDPVDADDIDDYADGFAFVWGSSDESKATVTNSGIVTAVSAGSVTITAYLVIDDATSANDGDTVFTSAPHSVTVNAAGTGPGPVTGVQIVVTGPSQADKNLVAGTITQRDIFSVSATVANVTPAGSKDATLEYRWFQAINSTTAALTDPAAPGSVWTAAAADGNVFQVPTTLTASANGTGDSLYYYYCRVRSTLKSAADPTKDSLDMKTSAIKIVTVKARPTITGTLVAAITTPASGGATQVVGSIPNVVLTVSGATNAGGVETNEILYQWYYNGTNSTEGGVAVSEPKSAANNGNTFTVPTTLQTGYYYYFCELTAPTKQAPSVRTSVVPFTVTPVTSPSAPVLPLSASNIVQVNNGTAEFSQTAVMKLTIPNAGANVVSPVVTSGGTNLSFAVIKVIYQGAAKDGSGNPVDSVYADADNGGKSYEDGGRGTYANPFLISDHKVRNAGTYNVAVVVRSTNTDGNRYEGSRTVTFTVNPKQISAINVKSLTPASVPYDGKTKVPTVTLTDGTGAGAYSLRASTNGTAAAASENGTDGTNNDYNRKDGDLTNAGTATVTFTGINNYTGTLTLSFAITKKEITIDTNETKKVQVPASVVGGRPTQPVWLGKTYDGTAVVDPEKLNLLDVRFNGLINSSDLSNGFGYTVTALAYDAAGAGDRIVNGTVRLDTATAAGSSLGRNYTFAGSSVTSGFAVSGVKIEKKAPVTADFDFTIPTNKYFTGSGQGIGSVAWQSKYTSAGDTRTVYYNGNDGLGALSTLPVGSANGDKTYTVTLNVSGSNNFKDSTGILLSSEFKILKPQQPTVIITNVANGTTQLNNINAYIGDTLTLRAVVTKPDSVKFDKPGSSAGANDTGIAYKGGTLAYVWFIDTAAAATRWDTLKIGSAVVRSATYTTVYTVADTATVKTKVRNYKAAVTWSYPSVQADVVDSAKTEVTINKEREDIAAAVVTVGGTYTYNGGSQTVLPTSVRVVLSGKTLEYSEDGTKEYTFDVFGEEAGTGVVSVTGTGKYKGKASGTFEIAKKTTVQADLKFSPASTSVPYNGAAQPLTVSPAKGDGLGAVTIKYLDISDEDNPVTLTAAPKNAGAYKTLIAIAEGKNFTELEEFERFYTITKRFVEKADFNYTMPRNGATPTAITATLKNPMGYTGTLTTLYRNSAGNDLTTVPTTEGKYAVRVRVGGDDNFGMVVVTLDTLKIDENGKVGVKVSDREVPKSSETNVVAVAPVKVAATSFTAGPSPASLSKNGAIKFFSAKSVKSGSLYIFDANGNSVAKLSAKSASGEIASWNLKDKKGAEVSEGTYVVKGVLVGKDGTKEKVSFPFSVVK